MRKLAAPVSAVENRIHAFPTRLSTDDCQLEKQACSLAKFLTFPKLNLYYERSSSLYTYFGQTEKTEQSLFVPFFTWRFRRCWAEFKTRTTLVPRLRVVVLRLLGTNSISFVTFHRYHCHQFDLTALNFLSHT